MGRQVRRVALDFDWPMDKVWPGFVCTLGGPCPGEGVTCFSGYTAGGKWLESIARLIGLVGEEAAANTPENHERFAKSGRLYPHPYLEEWPQAPRHDMPRDVRERLHGTEDSHARMRELWAYSQRNPPKLLPLTDDLRELVEGLYGRKLEWLNGSGLSWEISAKLRAAAGVGEKWGTCPICDGHGDDPAKRAEADAWEPTKPPTGEGWQLWETVPEGSPVSPVFPDAEGLAVWVSEHMGTTLEGARRFVAEGWAPSLVGVAGHGLVSGVKAIADGLPDLVESQLPLAEPAACS